MLVILLPMTGCFNDIVGDTIADDSDYGYEWYDGVYTLRVAPDTAETIYVYNATILVEEIHQNTNEGWQQYGNVDYSITCDNGDEIASRFAVTYTYPSVFLPVTGGECEVTFSVDYAPRDTVIIYKLVPNIIV